jgi:hypothetical protein
MTDKTAKRLARLDQAFAPKGCSVCRRWSPVVLCDDEGDPGRPEVCPNCGRVVPIVTAICIVGVPLETLSR